MTGAYAHDWSGRGAWAQSEGRGCGPREGGRGEGRGPGRGGPGREGPGRGGPGRGGRFGGEGSGFPIEALMGWAMSRGRGGPGGPGRPGREFGPEDWEKIEEMIALRRMRGRGPGLRGPGRGPRGRGRRRRGDVRLAVLRLLADEQRNGYQLMQIIEERSEGQWRPSPGSMYPTLAQLEDEGLIRSTESDAGRRFEITDAGRGALEERAGEPDPWTPEPDADEHAMSELGPLVIGIGKAVWQLAAVADETQRAKAIELLAETRRALYGILAEAPEGSDSEEPGEPGDSEG
jgi:DNA-binding PadR family transcriptional regulator